MGIGLREVFYMVIIIAILGLIDWWIRIIRGPRVAREDGPPDALVLEEEEIPFQILGLTPSATWEEIERAYHRKAKKHHPDCGGDADIMYAINVAYNRLKTLHRKHRKSA